MHLDFQYALLHVLLLWILTAPHEFAHAWVATRLGDDTPRQEGRVTLNPLAHVDWLGTALLPFVTSLLGGGFLGWGKPVRTDTSKLAGGLNGLAVVALAGPASNVVMAMILAVVGRGPCIRSALARGFAASGVRLSLYLATVQPSSGAAARRFEAPAGGTGSDDRLHGAFALRLHAADRGDGEHAAGLLAQFLERRGSSRHLSHAAMS